MLEVVDQDQHPTVTDVRAELVSGAERLSDRLEDERGIADRRERHPEHPGWVLLGKLGRRLQGEPCLADPAGAGHGHQPRAVVARECNDRGQLPFAAEEGRWWNWQVRAIGAPGRRGRSRRPRTAVAGRDVDRRRRVIGVERRERRWQPGHVELVEVLGAVEVLQAELAQISGLDARELVVCQHGCGRLRREDLAAVGRFLDAGCVVDGDPVIAPAGQDQVAGVQPDADSHFAAFWPGVCVQRALCVCCCCNRVAGAREDVEEPVADGVHLLATVP